MQFKSRRAEEPIPNIDLIPMLNVMMAVLAFFVLISMTLAPESGTVEVQLPKGGDETTAPNPDAPAPFIARLTAEGDITVQNQPVADETALEREIRAYLANNETGAVLLIPDEQANYEQALQLLAKMRDIGGDRVSLGIESK
ncbi:MAG: biopolymer transporter ExbD [Jaaginema sp. PMC 1080.18]|nr:biopolymer transporter ExbD [Jaaginema sp. PMC 1080.18]MEC4864984.1 biopolymer transporter ExbD [Jaaginema sp. PMC 1078.18]